METALKSISSTIDTAWENWPYTPITDRPYQKSNLLFAQPDNNEYGSAYREQGIYQVTLLYPLLVGPAAADARANVIRSLFPRGSSFTHGGIVVIIDRTPEITPGKNHGDRWGKADGDRWAVTIKIRWFAHVSN